MSAAKPDHRAARLRRGGAHRSGTRRVVRLPATARGAGARRGARLGRAPAAHRRAGRRRRQHGRDRGPRPVPTRSGRRRRRPAERPDGPARRQGRGRPRGHAGRRRGPGRLRRCRHGHAARRAAAAGRRPWPTTTSRSAPGSSPTAPTCGRRQPRYRRVLGQAFHLLASAWVVGPVKDTQCGFKGFTREAAQDLFGATADHEHRVRRRAHLPGPTARLSTGDRADPLVRPARFADARSPGPRAARRVGPVPDPAHPSGGRPGRPPVHVTSTLRDGSAGQDRPADRRDPRLRPGRRGDRRRRRRHARVRLPRLPPGRRPVSWTAARLRPRASSRAARFGLFYYPPTFVPLVLPFGLLSATTAVWVWTALLIGAFLARRRDHCPCRATVRWWIVLLAGLSWPFVYAVKLGQVGPLLFLCFAVGWRWLDDPLRLGLSRRAGCRDQAPARARPRLGAAHRPLPRGRRRAPSPSWSWPSPRRCSPALDRGPTSSPWSGGSATRSRPRTTSRPGAIAYQLGLGADLASIIQLDQHGPGRSSPSSSRHDGRRPRPRTSSRSIASQLALADPLGPLRDAVAPAGRVPPVRRPLVGVDHPARHGGPAGRRSRRPSSTRSRSG